MQDKLIELLDRALRLLYKHPVITLLSICIAATPLYIKFYSYGYVAPDLAEKGLIFKDQIHLNQYRNIGTSNYGLLKFDLYTRSDRHGSKEIVRVKSYFILDKNMARKE